MKNKQAVELEPLECETSSDKQVGPTGQPLPSKSKGASLSGGSPIKPKNKRKCFNGFCSNAFMYDRYEFYWNGTEKRNDHHII